MLRQFPHGTCRASLRPWILSGSLFLAFWISTLAASSPQDGAVPFLRFRDLTLGYTGPDYDMTNLTEIRIGWFGPTNANDPLTGGAWWAANFAVQEANEQRGKLKEHRPIHVVSNQTTGSNRVQSPMVSEDDSKEMNGGLGTSSAEDSFSKLPIRLVPRWAVDPWGTGVSQLTRMVYDEQPIALMGSVDSASTHLAEQVVAKAQLPLVSPVVTDKSVTLAGVSWMFACAPADAVIARAVSKDILAALRANPPASQTGRRGLAMLACTDHESRMITREVTRELSLQGRLPDFRLDLPPNSLNFSTALSALEKVNPALLLIVAGPEDSARLVCAIRSSARGIQSSSKDRPGPEQTADSPPQMSGPVIYGCQAMARTRFLELAGPAAEGVRFPLLVDSGVGGVNAVRFAERHVAERHREPDYTAQLTYDATRLLIEAIRRAGPSRLRLREALVQLSPWEGVLSRVQFDGTGQNTRTNIQMGAIRNGRVVSLGICHETMQ